MVVTMHSNKTNKSTPLAAAVTSSVTKVPDVVVSTAKVDVLDSVDVTSYPACNSVVLFLILIVHVPDVVFAHSVFNVNPCGTIHCIPCLSPTGISPKNPHEKAR